MGDLGKVLSLASTARSWSEGLEGGWTCCPGNLAPGSTPTPQPLRLTGTSGETERSAWIHADFPEVSVGLSPLARSQENSFTKLSREEVAGLFGNRFTAGVLQVARSPRAQQGVQKWEFRPLLRKAAPQVHHLLDPPALRAPVWEGLGICSRGRDRLCFSLLTGSGPISLTWRGPQSRHTGGLACARDPSGPPWGL